MGRDRPLHTGRSAKPKARREADRLFRSQREEKTFSRGRLPTNSLSLPRVSAECAGEQSCARECVDLSSSSIRPGPVKDSVYGPFA